MLANSTLNVTAGTIGAVVAAGPIPVVVLVVAATKTYSHYMENTETKTFNEIYTFSINQPSLCYCSRNRFSFFRSNVPSIVFLTVTYNSLPATHIGELQPLSPLLIMEALIPAGNILHIIYIV